MSALAEVIDPVDAPSQTPDFYCSPAWRWRTGAQANCAAREGSAWRMAGKFPDPR